MFGRTGIYDEYLRDRLSLIKLSKISGSSSLALLGVCKGSCLFFLVCISIRYRDCIIGIIFDTLHRKLDLKASRSQCHSLIIGRVTY